MSNSNTSIEVKIFSEVDILVNNKSIFGKKMRQTIILDLLGYLLLNYETQISVERIVEDVLGEKSYKDSSKSLSTYIYRINKMLRGSNVLGKDISEWIRITGGGGFYKIVVDESVYYELRTYENYIKEAESNADINIRYKKIKKAYEMISLWISEKEIYSIWFANIRSWYSEQFCRISNNILLDLQKAERYEEALVLSNLALKIDPFDEQANIIYLRLLILLKRNQTAFFHYSYITEKVYEEMGIVPSAELVEIYGEIKESFNKIPAIEKIECKIEADNYLHEKKSVDAIEDVAKVMDYLRIISKSDLDYTMINMLIGLIEIKDYPILFDNESLGIYHSKIKYTLNMHLRESDHYAFLGKDKIVFLLINITLSDYERIVSGIRTSLIEEGISEGQFSLNIKLAS